MKLLVKKLVCVCLAFAASMCFANSSFAYIADPHPDDPWENTNRHFFEFNETLDAYFLRPVALTYRSVTPGFVDNGITNFFNNIEDVYTIGNSLLQLKPGKAAEHTARFMFNSTWGVAGLIDVATYFELERSPEDLGQTLGFWGVPRGPYIVMPFFGPSFPRHAVGKLTETFALSLNEDTVNQYARIGLAALDVVDTRADIIPAESLIVGDKYIFIRNSFIQLREYQLNDGEVDDSFISSEEDESYLEDF